MARKKTSWGKSKKPKEKKSSGNMRAIKKEVDGITFASTMESDYYVYLKAEKAAGRVVRFELQPEFPLQESFKKYGKTIRGIKYIADFKVWYPDGTIKIIDTKGIETADFKLKRKMFDFKYPDIFLQLIIWDKKNSVWADYDEFKKERRKKQKASNN